MLGVYVTCILFIDTVISCLSKEDVANVLAKKAISDYVTPV
jgi:hypothetical protein